MKLDDNDCTGTRSRLTSKQTTAERHHTSGILIADISSPHRPLYRYSTMKKFLRCTRVLAVCSVSGEASLSRLVFSCNTHGSSCTGQKGPWNPAARCHRHSHRSHPIIFKLGERASRPYTRLLVYANTWAYTRRSESPASPPMRIFFHFLSFFHRDRLDKGCTFICHRPIRDRRKCGTLVVTLSVLIFMLSSV